MNRIVITGGAGFIGSHLAIALQRARSGCRVTALDNLHRRGSELNLPRLAQYGVEFVRGDVRNRDDLLGLSPAEIIIDCAAEPSVQAGKDGQAAELLKLNLLGAANTLETARHWNAAYLLISSSRVYPIAGLNSLPYEEGERRFHWKLESCTTPGIGAAGVSEQFPLRGARSFYGFTKLAAEALVAEYEYAHGVPALINRCGVIAGPWQMARADQGFVSLWCARHLFNKPLVYRGFGGHGKQVRDVLHIDDFCDLVIAQVERLPGWNGDVYNVGGGPAKSVSLLELTKLCQDSTGRASPIDAQPATDPFDVRIYSTDISKVAGDFSWRPRRDPAQIVDDTCRWITEHRSTLEPILS